MFGLPPSRSTTPAMRPSWIGPPGRPPSLHGTTASASSCSPTWTPPARTDRRFGSPASCNSWAPRLKDGEAEVTKRRQAVPPPTFKDDGLLLKEAATIRSELTAQELLLNHMEAIAVKVDPPTTESGKALAEAIMALNEMKQATTTL